MCIRDRIASGFPSLKRDVKNIPLHTASSLTKKYTRPRNQFVLMRSLFNRRVNCCILQHHMTSSYQKKTFTLTSKITSELWNESSSELKRYFSLLAGLETNWHSYKHYRCWDRESSQTVNMEPIELSQVRARLIAILTLGVGCSTSTYDAQDMSLTNKSKIKRKKKQVQYPTCNNAKVKTKLPRKSKLKPKLGSNLRKLRFDSSSIVNQPKSVQHTIYHSVGIIEDIFLV